MRHQSEMLTSPVGAWVEPTGIGSTNVLYDAPAIEFSHTVYTVNISQPSFMRAPGECPGTYAVECAMDELADALGMDPLQLRLVNDSPNHPVKGVPWSTLVRTNGRPMVMLTPCSMPSSLTGMCPWS